MVRFPSRSSLGVFLSFVLLTPVACGGGNDNSSTYRTMGMAGIPSPTRVGANLVFADVAFNGISGGRLAVDTGSPLVIVDQTQFPGLMLANVTQPTVNMTVGSLTIDNIPVLPMQIGGGTMDPLNFAGLLGGNVMQQFEVRLDYAHPDLAFRLGMPPMEMPTDGVEVPGDAVTFSLQGGGPGRLTTGEVIHFKATRIPLTVEVEGTARPFILDTGASETTVRSALFTSLRSDGRAQISGLPISTVMGPGSASVTRVRTLKVGNATVTNPAVMTIGTMGEDLFNSIEQEVGHAVEGLLGGNFLREFMVTVDYPGTTLHLQRYTSAVIVDEFKRVGFELGSGTANHRYTVGVIYAGTDAAAKQLTVGDEVVSIDGQSLDPLDSVTADNLLNGTVGGTHAVGLGITRGPITPNTSVDVLIEDLIPAP